MDRGNRLLSLAVLVIVSLVVYEAYQFGARRSAAEIARVEAEAATLRAQRDSIVAVTSLRDSLKVEIRAVADSLGGEAEELRSRVSEMEEDRAQAQLDVWELRTTNDVEEEFARMFPEFAPTMRVTNWSEDPDGFKIDWLMVPLDAARAFNVYRLNSNSYEQQRDAYAQIDTLNTEIILLQDSIIELAEANEAAFETGYNEALTRYMALNQDYIDLLKEPRFMLPNRWGMLGGTLVGLTVGLIIN